MSLTSKVQSLLTAANAATGKSDATLTEGVQHLKDSYLPRTVYFYDYDATLLGSCPIGETLTVPEAPSHGDLIFDGWSFTLEEICAAAGDINVYAKFKTPNGATRIHITLPASALAPSLQFTQDKSEGVSIDWGDGSAIERVSGANETKTVPHTYASAGSYVITLMPDADCTWFPGSGDFVYSNYKTRVTAIEFGDRVSKIGNKSIQQYESMTSLLLSESIQQIDANGISGGYTPTGFVIPRSVKTLKSNALINHTYKIVFSEGLETLCIGSLQWMGALGPYIIIPNSVKTFTAEAFWDARNIPGISTKATSYGTQAFGWSRMSEYILGGIGRAVTSIASNTFQGTANYAESITIYTDPGYVTTAINNVRNWATNAAITIRSANGGTYEGIYYNPGEIMVTSHPAA